MYFFPWSTIAWLEFWSEMSRAWMTPVSGVVDNSRVVPFPTARARTRTAISRVTGARVVRLSV